MQTIGKKLCYNPAEKKYLELQFFYCFNGDNFTLLFMTFKANKGVVLNVF